MMLLIRLQTLCLFVLLGPVSSFEFSNGIITLPEYTLHADDVTASMKDIICHNLTVGDVDLNSQVRNEIVMVSAELKDVGLVCRMDLSLTWNDIQADAQAYIETDNTDVSSQFRLKGDVLQVDECVATVRLEEMDITGVTGLFGAFVDSMRESWMTGIENALGTIICEQFEAEIPNILGNNVKDLSALFARLAAANAHEWTPSYQQLTRDSPLVRLDKYESSIEMITQLAWMLSSYYLNSTKDDGTLVANSFARQLFHNNSNAYEMKNLFYSFDLKNSMLGDWGLDSVEIAGGSVIGLDSVVKFNGIIPTGPTTLQTSVVLQKLHITLDAVLYINETVVVDGTIVDSTLIADSFQVDLVLSNVFATIDLRVELLAMFLEDLQVGVLLSSPSILTCLLGAIKKASVANLRFEKLDYLAPAVTDLDPLLQKLLSGLLDLVMVKYADELPGVIGHLVNNAVLQSRPQYEGDDNTTCDFPSKIGTNAEHLDFRDLLLPPDKAAAAGATGNIPYGPRAFEIKDHIDNQLLKANPGTDRPFLNDKAPATTMQSGIPGTFTFTGRRPVFTYESKIAVGNSTIPINLAFKNVTINNLNHWLSPLIILQPDLNESSGLKNHIQFGMDGDPTLTISSIVELKIDNEIANDFAVNFETKSLSLLVDLLLNVREDPFLFYRVGDLQKGDCLASLLESSGILENVRTETGVPPFDLSAFDMQLKGVKLDVQCQTCSDGTTEMVAEVVSNIIRNVFADGLTLHMGYNQLAEKDETRNIVSELLNTIERRSHLLRHFFDKLIADSHKTCESSPEYDPNASFEKANLLENLGFTLQETFDRSQPVKASKENRGCMICLIVLICTLTCAWISFQAFLQYRMREGQREWLYSLAPSQLIAIYEEQEKSKYCDQMTNQCSQPIFFCESISNLRKISVIAALIGSIVLFLLGISSTAATISFDLYTSNAKTYSFSVDYTLMTIVELTWNSGGFFMAIVMAFLVGLWPMVRQFMTLFLLFIPSTYFDVTQRGQILLLLDRVGKLSMLVVLLGMLNTASFFTSIESRPDYILPFKLQLMYVPLWGTYATFLGQLISHIIAGAILDFHHLSLRDAQSKIKGPGTVPTLDGREDLSSNRDEEEIQDEGHHHDVSASDEKKREDMHRRESSCLATTLFTSGTPSGNKRIAVRPLGQKLLLTMAVVSVVLSCAGSVMTSYYSNVEGILNDIMALEHVILKMTTDHSVFSVMGVLLDQAASLNQPLQYLGHGLMLWYLLFGVVFAPVFLISVLLVQWLLPLTDATRRKLDLVIQRVLSWQATEIYIVATIAGAWQMDDLAYYMTSSMCWAFDPLIEFMAQNGWISHAQCFGVQGNVGGGGIALSKGARIGASCTGISG
ncbi:hypothetical protein FisN_16Lh261 [Fistulifera solaris]|uniref:Lipid-binding serum glycoprotein N-terminal domain-containing protein n=1 Tax=Fistulifera solaris TaxID=1519565 RepID=A0A1Z5J6L1_FISSO|nr:hypothetical protein FisN_16Lh261 [Fistulifera solaris]|eukprot:GAX09566.1 hypothetical protein FisN_16Lh261 [Fistulifera solaris]